MVPRGPAVLEQDSGPIYHLRGQCFSLNPKRHESCAYGPWPRSMDFPTARPIVVEERSRAISRWVMMRHALDGKRSWIVTQLVIPTDSPTASNIDCLSPPAEELQLDAVRVLLAVLAKSLQGAAVLCHARSYWKRKLRAAVRASAVPPGVSQISRG